MVSAMSKERENFMSWPKKVAGKFGHGGADFFSHCFPGSILISLFGAHANRPILG